MPAERTLYLDTVIASESWFDDDVTPAAFKQELMADSGPVTIAINSPGGDCIAASMIYTMLKEYPGHVSVRIEGVAASAASVISMAGDSIAMSPTSLMMIHNPSTIALGETRDMEKAIRLLEETKESIINAYVIRTGISREQLSRMMDDETWLNAVKAKELGFCDEILYADGQLSAGEDGQNAPSFIFSERRANLVLVNRICSKSGEGGRPPVLESSALALPKETVTEQPRYQAADLNKRLSLLR